MAYIISVFPVITDKTGGGLRVRQGTVLCLDKTKGKGRRTVPCPTYIRAGTKLVAEGTKIVNIARGISSVVGTIATGRLSMLQASMS